MVDFCIYHKNNNNNKCKTVMVITIDNFDTYLNIFRTRVNNRPDIVLVIIIIICIVFQNKNINCQ